jgi:hypothetical protein
MLDGHGVLGEVLDQQLILPLVIALTHLEHHVFVAFKFFWFINLR